MRLVFEIFPSFCYRRTRNQILQLLLHGNYVVAILPTGFGIYRSAVRSLNKINSQNIVLRQMFSSWTGLPKRTRKVLRMLNLVLPFQRLCCATIGASL